MRLLLIHAPPLPLLPDGPAPPPTARALMQEGDFLSLPLGLLHLHGRALAEGHQVGLVNLSNWTWPDIVELLGSVEAELFGLSCFTANRRGVHAVTRLIRQLHPAAHITLGGPFVTALAEPLMRRWSEVDSAVVGEGEATFTELLERLGRGGSLTGVAGLLWRDGDRVVVEPPRAPIAELDRLESPVARFPSVTVMTSRGCFGRCTFCASEALWGRSIRFFSPSKILEQLERLRRDHGLETVAFKDEVFTANRRRARALCQAMIDSKLGLRWSCDTRVDRVDPELFRLMRRAGCRQVSFGVESGAPAVLEALGKEITADQVLAATTAARDEGLEVRWFMMWGGPGESTETIEQSLELVARGRPSATVFLPLSVCPGTPLHHRYAEERGLPFDFFFETESLAVPYLGRHHRRRAEVLDALGDARGYRDLEPESTSRFTVRLPARQPTMPAPLAEVSFDTRGSR